MHVSRRRPSRLATALAAAMSISPATHLLADDVEAEPADVADLPAEQRVAALEAENAALRARVSELIERLEQLEAQQRATVPVEVERADAMLSPPPTPATPEPDDATRDVAAPEPASADEARPAGPTPPAERITVGPIQIEPEDVRGDVFLSAVARPGQPQVTVFLHGRNTEAGLGGRRFREQDQDRRMNWRIDGETVILPVAKYEWTQATSRIAGKKTQGRGDELIEFKVPRELLERASLAEVWEILVSRSTLTMGSEPRALAREALRER